MPVVKYFNQFIAWFFCLINYSVRVKAGLFFLVVVQLLLACGGGSAEGQSSEPANVSKFAIPPQLKSENLPSDGRLRALLVVDLEFEFEMDINGEVAEATLDALTTGAHSILVLYEFEHPNFDTNILLGDAFKSFTVEEGGNTSISFDEGDFIFDIDTDGDGVSNFDELIANRNPLVAEEASTLVVDISELVSQMNFLSQGSLQAIISIDGKVERMSIVDGIAQVEFEEIELGDHAFSMFFVFDHSEYGKNIRVAQAAELSVTLVAGVSEVSLTGEDFDSDIDTDGDGVSNLIELSDASNPLVSGENESASLQIVTLDFPPSSSLTYASSVVVRGSGNDSIADMRVNGVIANTTDNFATWTATVPLSLGENPLSLEFVDKSGNTGQVFDVAEVKQIERSLLTDPLAIALDSPRNRLLVTNRDLDAIVAVDLTTGSQSIFSDNAAQISDMSFSSPQEMVVDEARNRALVYDSDLETVVAVNLQTGVRSEFTNDISDISSMAIDTIVTRLLLTDSSSDELVGVNLVSGDLFDVADIRQSSVAIVVDGDRALILNQIPAVDSLDFFEYNTASLSNNFLPNADDPFVSPVDIALDRANGRALVVDEGRRGILEVNLNGGRRSIFSNNVVPSQNNPFFKPGDLVVDSENNRALVLDIGLDKVVSVDLVSGSRRLISNQSIPDSENALFTPGEISIDKASEHAILTDAARESIAHIDLSNGKRTHFSLNGFIEDGSVLSFSPLAVIAKANANQAFVLDSNQNVVLSMNTATGEFEVLSGQDKGVILTSPQDMAIDNFANRLLISDSESNSIIAVDQSSGQRSILSNGGGGVANGLLVPSEIVVDENRNRLLVADNEARAIYSVNLLNGERAQIWIYSGENATEEQIRNVADLAIDTKNDRVVIVDDEVNALISIDLNSGERKNLFDASSASLLEKISGLTIDNDKDFAYVTDSERGAVIVVDLTTGEQVVFSQ